MRGSFLNTVAAASVLGVSAATARADQVVVTVETDHAIATVDSRYVSVAIDMAEIVGGPWWGPTGPTTNGRGGSRAVPIDLNDARLRTLARALAPAILRIGGTEADFVGYDMSPIPGPTPPGYDSMLTARRWDEIQAFKTSCGLDLMFALDAGPTERDLAGAWQPDHASALLDRAAAFGQTVDVWELGNEPNAFWLTHGILDTLTGSQFADDYATARDLVRADFPRSRLSGPGDAFWPILGEPLGPIFGVTEPFLRAVTGDVDLITWHYYPTESDRAPFAVRRADLATMLDPATLDEVSRWATQMNDWRDQYRPGAEIWLGETGPAQCGGQAGLSDTHASTFWWLDQLGLLATLGQRLQVRQTLVGADYGLLRADDLAPNPDYWAALLWKGLMGEDVLSARVSGGSGKLRAYAHRTASSCGAAAGSVTVLLLNLSLTGSTEVTLDGVNGSTWSEFVVAAPNPLSRTPALNGVPLALNPDGSLPLLEAATGPARTTITLAPLSYELVVVQGP